MSGGGFSFMSSIRLLPFGPVLFTLPVRRRSFNWICLKKGKIKHMMSKNQQKYFCAVLWFHDDSEDGKDVFHKRTWSLFEGTTVDTEGGILVEEGVEEPRRAELATWTTLVTVMVCLILFAADCLVTTVPSDGNWFSWFKTNVVVDGWGLCCWRH